MALGPGKYDDLATEARKQTQAEGAVVIIVNGVKGSGFSAQLSPELTLKLPSMLRHMADELERWGPTS